MCIKKKKNNFELFSLEKNKLPVAKKGSLDMSEREAVFTLLVSKLMSQNSVIVNKCQKSLQNIIIMNKKKNTQPTRG